MTDPDGITGPKELNWQYEQAPGTWVTFAEGASSGVLTDLVVNRQIRVEVTFVDDRGTPEAFASAPVGPVANVNDAPQGVPTIAPDGRDGGRGHRGRRQRHHRRGQPGRHPRHHHHLAAGSDRWWRNVHHHRGCDRTHAHARPAAQANRQVRAVATYTDGFGTVERVVSDPSPVVGDLFIGNGQANTFDRDRRPGTVPRAEAATTPSTALAGADTLLGEGGNDTLNGGDDNDVLDGGGGTDTLVGGVGDDALNGGAAADQLTGGAGNDTITPGAGNDVIRFNAPGFGTDTVADFDANPGGGGQDLLNVNGTGVNRGNFTARVTLGGRRWQHHRHHHRRHDGHRDDRPARSQRRRRQLHLGRRLPVHRVAIRSRGGRAPDRHGTFPKGGGGLGSSPPPLPSVAQPVSVAGQGTVWPCGSGSGGQLPPSQAPRTLSKAGLPGTADPALGGSRAQAQGQAPTRTSIGASDVIEWSLSAAFCRCGTRGAGIRPLTRAVVSSVGSMPNSSSRIRTHSR